MINILVLYHSSNNFSTIKNANIINKRILNLEEVNSNNSNIERKLDLKYIQERTNNLRNKSKSTGSALNSYDVNDNEEENLKLLNDDKNGNDIGYNLLTKKYPFCEAKYKLVDKLKKIKFFYKLVENKKKIVIGNSCIEEIYGILFITIRNTNDILSVVATVLGYVPHIFIVLILIGYLITYSEVVLYFIFIISAQIILTDLILKNIIQMKRPENSALLSYGMPSGHSTFSLSIITFTALHLTQSYKDKWNIITCILSLITLFPITWSRVYIEDHTLSQIIVGSLLGLFLGCFFFVLKRKFLKNKNSS